MSRAPSVSPGRKRCSLCLTAALTTSLVLVPPVAGSALSSVSTVTAEDRVLAALQHFFDRATPARQYSASRRLEASGSGQQAWLDVQTDYTASFGLVYEVTAEGGSGYIRSRVLRSLLDEEQRLVARGASAAVAITPSNYRFIPEAVDADGLAVVGIRPLRKAPSLIAGRIFLTAAGDLVRIEGRLVKNPSFWVTRVQVVRSYRRINGVLMPVALETTAQLRLLGSSVLRMTYRYVEVDDRAVAE